MGFLTLAEAARRLGVSRATLYRWAKSGRLSLHKVGPRATRVREEEVHRLVEAARPLYARPPSRGGSLAEASSARLPSYRKPDEDDPVGMEADREALPPYERGPRGVRTLHPTRHVPGVAPPTVAEVAAVLRGELAAETDVAFAYLFGSLAKGQARRDSDVDLAIGFSHHGEPCSTKIRMDRKLALEGKLERALDREVDLVILNDAPLDLVQEVLRTGRLVHAADEAARHSFYVQHVYRYLDMAYARSVFDRAMMARIREGSFGGGGGNRS